MRDDEFDLQEVESCQKILLCSGPGIPDEAGLLKQAIKHFASTKSILGICLGQQAIGEVFGGSLINLEKVYHGVATKVTLEVNDEELFKDIPTEVEVGRYHSWVVSNDGFPEDLEITSKDENGQIMSLRHKKLDLKGVQFHPESVLTPHGKTILKNWLES